MARVDRDRQYISWRSMALGSVLLAAVFLFALQWIHTDTKKLQAQDTTLQYTLSVMEMDYADLLLQLRRVGSDGYVENEAREKLKYIRDGEILFAFENPELLKGYTEEEYQIIMNELRD